MIKVLYTASEAIPFIKTGGLADVAFSLPKALVKMGIDVRVVIPKYENIPKSFTSNMKSIKAIEVPVGWRRQYCGLLYMEYEGVPFYFIDNEYYFKRNGGYGIYGFYDEAERFAFFNRSVLEIIPHMDFKPDIIHCNDWHTGMVSPLLQAHYKEKSDYKNIKTVFTIHNLKYQGIFPSEILGELLDLGPEYNHMQALEFYGGVSFMKGGLNYSDRVTTVSKSYAEEIQSPFYGEKLEGLLRDRRNDLSGIPNGIDYDLYDPENDPQLFSNYAVDSLHLKKENKINLQGILDLPQKGDIPMIGMITRFDRMKGLDLVVEILGELLEMDVQMVVLGTGDADLEGVFKDYQNRYPKKMSAHIMFDQNFAAKMYAGCDMLLMPSLFEPCGLAQLIAMRYGTLPIVRETGGLKDTVTSYNEFTGEGNGFSFTHYNALDLLNTIKRALAYYKNQDTWQKIVQQAMVTDYSWKKSGILYKELYEGLIEIPIENS